MITAASGGYLLYLVVAALLVLFWRHVRGLSFDALLARAAREHITSTGSWPSTRKAAPGARIKTGCGRKPEPPSLPLPRTT